MGVRLGGLLFDFDDTLVDWSSVRLPWREIESARLSRVADYLCHSERVRLIKTDALVEVFLQNTREAWAKARISLRAPHMPSILMSSLDELGVPARLLDADELIRVYRMDVAPGVVVFPDVPPALRVLRAAGIKLGIVTNAAQPMFMRDAELATHGLLEYFPDCRLSAADVGYIKPHARIFNAALERMGTAPAETVFVGDNPEADIAGAQAVGMRAILRITDRAFDNGDLAQPQERLDTLDELPAILDGWYPGWRDGGA
ncbi:MAG: HAD family hydrolase [Chloroflexi bacterium]|nr:HAD family hydrolase [Chloroflexota bacterium]